MAPKRVDLSDEARRNYEMASNGTFEDRRKAHKEAKVGLAEGDSWFDYQLAYVEDPLRGDLLGHLQHSRDYVIYRVSHAGDTLENMIYGSRHGRPPACKVEQPQIVKTFQAMHKVEPQFLLFSGGGNDIAGDELRALLNHAMSGLPLLRKEVVDYIFDVVMLESFKDLIHKLRIAARDFNPDIPVFFHGYDYAIPDGRGVDLLIPGWTITGPWLKPAFASKHITEEFQCKKIINHLIDRFNGMLQTVAAENDNVYYIDLRGTLGPGDWANELHPTAKGFGKVADKFLHALGAVL